MVIFSLVIAIPVFGADEDAAQKEACSKNSAMEWNVELGRCVGKAAARQTRHEAQACDALTDIAAQKACHMRVAESKTGVSGDAEKEASKVNSLQSRSTIINTANTVVAAINMIAKDSSESKCMSKQIFGITALGGFLTDIYMKINTKKKLNSLKDKFVVDNKDNAYSSQVKALEYLKEEQEVIKKIASQEKKRQMLLMIGYGAAAATAVFETITNDACYAPQETKSQASQDADKLKAQSEAEGQKSQVQAKASGAPAPAPEEGAQTYAVKEPGPIETRELPAQNAAPASSPAPEVSTPKAAAVSETRMVSQKNGNFQNNYLETDGKVVGVVHNGQVYEKFSVNSKGIYVAQGTPSGTFDYNSGSWGSQKVNVAVTSGYEFNGGKIVTNNSSLMVPTSSTKDLSFGTNKVGKK